MKLKGRLSFLIDRDSTRIKIEDDEANVSFCNINLTPEQTMAILSRQGSVVCDMEIRFLERIGKKHENKDFEFIAIYGTKQTDLELACNEALYFAAMYEWISDHYYNSQNSLFKKDDVQWARTTIRRWI